MTTISSKTILRSRNSSEPGKVLSTLLLRYPHWIHAELMTHRVFSRNAASSRAIPVSKRIQDVRDDPAIPLFWGKNQSGMQAFEETDAPVIIQADQFFDSFDARHDPISREKAWLWAMEQALKAAEAFAAAGYHKQIVNRLFEPFAHITVLVSATEWDNFLELRDHPDAEPHIAILAREVRKCLECEDDIQTLDPGEWHLPFVDASFEDNGDQVFELEGLGRPLTLAEARKLSVARCASTSYKTVDDFDMTLERALQLHNKLINSKPIHASPAEHTAKADLWIEVSDTASLYDGAYDHWENEEQHGNFVGFRQYRHML